MKTTYAFLKKEWLEYYRSGKLCIVGVVFALFGLMNPAIAKLTPFLIEKLASSGEMGMTITMITPDATTSWGQFYKNIPMALIVCVLMFGGTMATEIQKGTLIPVLTKGLARWKVLLAKGLNLLLIWTIGYWACYGITYFYTAYYWDNSIMNNLGFSAFCYWLFGMFVMAMIILFSAVAASFGTVILGVGICYFAMTLLSIVPSIAEILPTYLTGALNVSMGIGNPEDFVTAILVTVLGLVGCIVGGCLIFNKREMP